MLKRWNPLPVIRTFLLELAGRAAPLVLTLTCNQTGRQEVVIVDNVFNTNAVRERRRAAWWLTVGLLLGLAVASWLP